MLLLTAPWVHKESKRVHVHPCARIWQPLFYYLPNSFYITWCAMHVCGQEEERWKCFNDAGNCEGL